MSWFARSIANTLKLDDDEDQVMKIDPKAETPNDDASSPTSPSRGVKEDLSELTKTLTNQFWGVASFLAPAPQAEPRSEPETSRPEPDSILGIRGDFAEIGGKFRSGISRLSNNINVSEITKMASNFLQLESDDEDAEMRKEGFDLVSTGAVGVTEEVVAFVRDIAMHPETWLDFPLPDDTGDHVDFDLSDVQQEHALAVERLAPRLAALRIELCPGYMSESCFWKIYFVLVHPRLDKQDAELLSTPQIVEARALLAHELKKRTTAKPEDLSEKKSIDSEENDVSHHEEPLCVPSPENKQDKTSDLKITTSTASEIVKVSVDSNKSHNSVTEEEVKNQSPKCDVEKDDDDDWLKEETSEIGGKTIPIENEDDVSFSDLEEDDDDEGDVPTSYRKSNYSSSDKESRDWVQLGKNAKHSSDNENAANKESNDWLDVDDIVVT